MTIYYLPLEPYQERYTLQLKDWTLRAFTRNSILPEDVKTIEPFGFGDNAIIENTGPLDYWRRTRWSLLQVEQTLALMSKTETSSDDAIYFQDMFHPGIEALAYIFSQKPVSARPKIFVQNCAQSVDIYDFTYPMMHWMRPYELMVDNLVSGVFVASEIHAELMRVSGFRAPIYITGLPFDKEEVIERLTNYGQKVIPWHEKKNQVVFSSRFDKEKQPHFFLDLVVEAKSQTAFADTKFILLQGGIFNSTEPYAVERAREMESRGLLEIHERLSKEDYYKILNESKVQINTALQDFVSNTLNEASAFCVKSLLPCFRSFPEAINSNPKYLYTPWNKSDFLSKLNSLLTTAYDNDILFPANFNHKTLDKVVSLMLSNSPKGNYNGIH